MKFPALHALAQNLLEPVIAGPTVIIAAGSRGVVSMTTALRNLTRDY